MARDQRKTMLRVGVLLDECQICPKNQSESRHIGKIEAVCGGCSVYAELTRLRPGLQKQSTVRFQSILAKGQEMTRSDIAFLLENEVQKRDIRKALRMGVSSFNKLMGSLGFSLKNCEKGVEEVAVAIKLSVEEYAEFKSQGLKDIEIASKLGFNKQQMANWKYTRKDQLAAAGLKVKEGSIKVVKNDSVPVEQMPTAVPVKQTPVVNKKDEYAELIGELSAALDASKQSIADRDILIGNLQEKIKNYETLESEFQQVVKKAGQHEETYKEEITRLHAACEDVETELEKVRGERDRMIQANYLNSYTIENQKRSIEDKSKQLKKISGENAALRKLVQLWS